jgi:hypothetical protein
MGIIHVQGLRIAVGEGSIAVAFAHRVLDE